MTAPERQRGYDLERISELLEGATPGEWVEDGLLVLPGGVEADARIGDEDWVTFKTDRAAEDRALVVAAVNALPSMIADLRALREARESGALRRAYQLLDPGDDLSDWGIEDLETIEGMAQCEADATALRKLASP